MSEWEVAARILGTMVSGLVSTIVNAIRGDDSARQRLVDVMPDATRGDLEKALDDAALERKFGSER